MKTVEVKTADLIAPALDWAVAKALDWKEPHYGVGAIQYIAQDKFLLMEAPDPHEPYDVTQSHHFNHYEQWSPSRIWSQGGPLIDTHQIEFSICDTTDIVGASMLCWKSYGKSHRTRWSKGATHLIAACRAIVAAKLGDTVSVPAELAHPTATI